MPSAAWRAPRPRVIVRFFRKATCGLPAITVLLHVRLGRRRLLVRFLREAVMGRVGRRVATLESS